MAKKSDVKTVIYSSSFFDESVELEVVNELNDNNFDLKDSDGNIIEKVIRKEFHNANELVQGHLRYFEE
jgi:hypothetical protein